MYVNVNIDVPLGRAAGDSGFGCPAIGHAPDRIHRHGQGYLEPREIETGSATRRYVVVLKGLKAGDRIVSSANFLIDSEANCRRDGSFVPPPPERAQRLRMKHRSNKSQIDFSTDPSPPRKGANIVRVKLTSADGKPVAGAQVTVTFFMPAMPAMGMAAMHAVATLTDKGNGIYEGPLRTADPAAHGRSPSPPARTARRSPRNSSA